MVNVVIRGGDADGVAVAMTAAISEIFGIEPTRTAWGEPLPGTRSLVDALLIVLAIPPGAFYAKKLAEDFHLGDRVSQLIGRAEDQSRSARADLRIDLGDGKPIPLLKENRQKILKAITAWEDRGKSRP